MYTAWQVERFAREERLKPFKDYAARPGKGRKAASDLGQRQTPGEMLAAFQDRIQAGAPIAIEIVDAPRRRSIAHP